METQIVVFVCGGVIVLFYRLYRCEKVARRCLATTTLWCDASEARREWLLQNPLASHSHQKHQELLQRELGCYMLWLDAHPHYLEHEDSRKSHEEALRHLAEKINEPPHQFY